MTYALGIYLLNLLIAFLSPKIDPALLEFEEEGAVIAASDVPNIECAGCTGPLWRYNLSSVLIMLGPVLFCRDDVLVLRRTRRG